MNRRAPRLATKKQNSVGGQSGVSEHGEAVLIPYDELVAALAPLKPEPRKPKANGHTNGIAIGESKFPKHALPPGVSGEAAIRNVRHSWLAPWRRPVT